VINIFFEEIEVINLEHLQVNECIFNTIENENKVSGEINFILCSDKYILQINQQFLNHDYYTDVITFNYCEDNNISGDIFISIERVHENANDFKVSFENELLRVMIHGVLHLIGYSDESDEEKKNMHKKEDEYLPK
jgi:probable rRNA maturation factor